jgi:hypothetical protein
MPLLRNFAPAFVEKEENANGIDHQQKGKQKETIPDKKKKKDTNAQRRGLYVGIVQPTSTCRLRLLMLNL